MINEKGYSLQDCDRLRNRLKSDFEIHRSTWKELMHWTLPYAGRYLSQSTTQSGSRNNHHIVDPSHILALRSYVAGFLEGNTSASRPWYRLDHRDKLMRKIPSVRQYIDDLSWRSLQIAGSSNLYHALAEAYYYYGVVNTAVIFIEEYPDGLHFRTLAPGTFYLLNDFRGRANHLVREFPMNVGALVKEYGKKDKNGKIDWSNFTSHVRNFYERGDYNQVVMVCNVIKPNDKYDVNQPEVELNRPWISLTYEMVNGNETIPEMMNERYLKNEDGTDKFLRIGAFQRKPFIAFNSTNLNNCPYGEFGPTYVGIGLIKSMNKKAITKDVALEQMVRPTTQGPASIKKSYMTLSPGGNIPLNDAQQLSGGLKRVFEISPAIQALVNDSDSLTNIINKIYYQDFLLYLTQNPKTRTAREVAAVQSEQQLVIGPNLQSLNWTLNKPLVEYLVNYVIFEDPFIGPPPPELQGESLDPVFISLFAQSQKSADLPSIEKYVGMVANLAPVDRAIVDKLDVDFLADLLDDRLYLPPGLNRDQGKTDAIREKREQQLQQAQQLQETVPALAGAAKDLGLNFKQS